MGRSAGDVGDLDVLVLGSGVAGLSAVVRLASPRELRVGVLTKAELSQSATRWAQGGVAAVLGDDEDSTDLHLADTLAAGAGLCDVDAIRTLVDEGPRRVRELITLGAVFDKEAGGALALAREGGHSTARVLHAGGAATGVEVERALVSAVELSAAAVLERWFALDLIVEGDRCVGVTALDPRGVLREVRAANVVIATGGAGQMYAVTTNPREATGDGIAMALRAGVDVADVEFIQFHPTALHHPAMPRPLLSEALRGHGALLRDSQGERFVDELAARDVVSRAMAERMNDQRVEHLWLDATGLASFEDRFPTIALSLQEAGLDPSADWLPIAPAAHHLSGGVLTDLDGASTLAGLWAAGEAACTGVHGANRLASNSLLEGMVFGARVAEAIESGHMGPTATGAMRCVRSADLSPTDTTRSKPIACTDIREHRSRSWRDPQTKRASSQVVTGDLDASKLREGLETAMTQGAGVLRSAESLAAAASTVRSVREALGRRQLDRETAELANLADLALAVLCSAQVRTETRGAHARREHPEAVERWRLRLVHRGS